MLFLERGREIRQIYQVTEIDLGKWLKVMIYARGVHALH